MISCNLKGPGAPGGIHNFGLGNILFQIATAISLAKDLNTFATFPDLKSSFFGEYQNNILAKVHTHGSKPSNNYNEQGFEYSKIPETDNITLNGYFQSEEYFAHNRDIILDVLSPSLDVEGHIKKYSHLFLDKTVSLHIRRGDYVNLQDYHHLLSIDYYESALNEFDYDRVVIFSDDIEWCKKNTNFKNQVFIEGESDYIDMYLMSKIKNNIIANSTFSWWGAWLNNNEDRKIIAPNKWFGDKNSHTNTKNLIPKEWNKK